jgi:hypothetical protein
MAYRNDFYNPGNIIGYTGDLLYYPTVYFGRGAADGARGQGYEYGHITQYHKLGQNVGREAVRWSKSYTIQNYLHKGKVVNHEWADAERFHVSRTPLITSDRFRPGDLSILREAITLFPDLKLMYSARLQVRRKKWLNEELLEQFNLVKHDRLALFGKTALGNLRDANPGATHVIDRQILLGGGRVGLLTRKR